jgi:lipoyl(octanoyl) transferase
VTTSDVADFSKQLESLLWPTDSAAGPAVMRLGDADGLCPYDRALQVMETLVERPAHAPDVLLPVQHPPTLTVGRKGGLQHVHARTWLQQGREIPIQIHEVARGGSVTWHAPGQLVVYPVVQVAKLEGPVGRGPLGDLPGFIRVLERALQETCATYGLETKTRRGFAGLWLDDTRKLASIGVAVRNGWTFHGLALNVTTDLSGFDLITPCGLTNVRMTSMRAELGDRCPSLAAVEDDLIGRLSVALRRRN